MTLRQQNKHLYWVWKSMKQRCQNPRCHAYSNYGARGIKVCGEWQEYEPFYEWAISNGWKYGLDLDRCDNNGNYSPNNCRWVSRKENINNRRRSIILNVDGVSLPRTELENLLHLPNGTIKLWVSTHGYEYAESRIKEIIQYGYKKCDYSRNHIKINIMCVETGKIYESYHAASRELGLNHGNISRAVKQNSSTGGYHFRIIT